EVEHLDGVRMVQARSGLGLAVEAGGEGGVGRVLAVQHLDGDRLFEGNLPRPEHGPHGAASDEVLDHEFAGDRSAGEALVVALLHPPASVAWSDGRSDAVFTGSGRRVYRLSLVAPWVLRPAKSSISRRATATSRPCAGSPSRSKPGRS